MGYEVHIRRFSDDLEREIPITKQEWIECTQHVEELKWIEENSSASIQAYSEQHQEWTPLFWIDNQGNEAIRAKGFFNNDISISKAYQIADHLTAFIYGNEGEIYFLPGYGALFDDEGPHEGPRITFEDIKRLKPAYRNNYEKILQVLIDKYISESREKSRRSWWLIGMVGFAVLLLYMLVR